MDKVKTGLIIAVAVLTIALVGVIIYFTHDTDPKPNIKVIEAQLDNKRLEQALDAQRGITDSLVKAYEAKLANIIPDTVYVQLNKKYDDKINHIKQLTPSEQVSILTDWLPKADSTRK